MVNCYNRDFALQEFWKDCMLLKMKVLVIRLRSPSMSQKQSLHWKILEFPTSPPPKKKSKGGDKCQNQKSAPCFYNFLISEKLFVLLLQFIKHSTYKFPNVCGKAFIEKDQIFD